MIIRNLDEIKAVFRLVYRQVEIMLENGKQVILEASEAKKTRSNAANNYYWQINKEVADCLNGAGCTYGEYELPYNKDIIHDIQKKVFGVETTTKMTVREFCDYETQVIQFWQEKTNGEFLPSELPERYLIERGYDLERNLRC